MGDRPNLASRMRHRITVNRSVEVSDGRGGYDDEWQPIATLYAEVTSLASREALIAQAMQGVSSYKIVVRYGADVRVSDQILHDGKTLNVRSADDPDGKRVALLILADTANAQAMT